MRGMHLHGEAGDLLLDETLHQRRLMPGVNEGNEDGAFLHRVDHIQSRRLDRKHDVGVGHELVAIGDEDDVLERGVGQLDGFPGAALHVQLGAELDQLGDDRRHQGNAPLVRLGLLQDGDVDVHGQIQLLAVVLRWDGPARIEPARICARLTAALRPPRSGPASCSRTPGCPCRRARARNRSS